MNDIGSIAFGLNYRGKPVSEMAVELEKYFNRFLFRLEVVSENKLRMGAGNYYYARDPISWDMITIPLHRNVDIVGHGKVYGIDFRPFYKGECEVFVDDVSVFTGSLVDSARIMNENVLIIVSEAKMMMKETIAPSNIVEIERILGSDFVIDELLAKNQLPHWETLYEVKNPSQKEEIITIINTLSKYVRLDSLCKITVEQYRYEIRLRNPVIIGKEKKTDKTFILEKSMYSNVHDYRVLTCYEDSLLEVLTHVDPTGSFECALARLVNAIVQNNIAFQFVIGYS